MAGQGVLANTLSALNTHGPLSSNRDSSQGRGGRGSGNQGGRGRGPPPVVLSFAERVAAAKNKAEGDFAQLITQAQGVISIFPEAEQSALKNILSALQTENTKSTQT